MSKLTKQQAALHAQACAYLEKDVLTLDERMFVLDHWQGSANHINGVAGAFFTPQTLASDFSIEVTGRRVIDLCAGIGSLAFAYYHRDAFRRGAALEIVCVEQNPDYVAVGRKVLPEATWILANVLELPATLGKFDCAIANPPFGRIKSTGTAQRYTGAEFEYSVIDVARDIARCGVFLIPQGSAPFSYSGQRSFQETSPSKYLRFRELTGIELEANCGLDTSRTLGDWHGVSVATEIVLADFTEVQQKRAEEAMPAQAALFAAA
jgi:hypothetical protein